MKICEQKSNICTQKYNNKNGFPIVPDDANLYLRFSISFFSSLSSYSLTTNKMDQKFESSH